MPDYASLREYLSLSVEVLRAAATPDMERALAEAVDLCVAALDGGKPILVCGNGGSAADALHIEGELVARFLKNRRALNCICLSSNPSMITAWANDIGYESVFSRQVEAYGRNGGVLIGISTSGTSKNVVAAAQKAKDMGLAVIGLMGQGREGLAPLCDVVLAAPSDFTPMVQQVHLCLYHYLCERIEARAIC